MKWPVADFFFMEAYCYPDHVTSIVSVI